MRDCSGGWGRCARRWDGAATSWPWQLRLPGAAETRPRAVCAAYALYSPTTPAGRSIGRSLCPSILVTSADVLRVRPLLYAESGGEYQNGNSCGQKNIGYIVIATDNGCGGDAKRDP